MKARAVLVSSLAVLLAAGTGCASAPDDAAPPENVGTTSAALDDFRNCTPAGDSDYDCGPHHSGSPLALLDGSVFTLQTMSKDQRGVLTNTGSASFSVIIEQGLAWSSPVVLAPGESRNIAPIDDNYFSWTNFSVLIKSPDDACPLSPDTTARLHIGQFSPEHDKCNETCTTRWNGCHSGCALDPHANAWCLAGCDFAYDVCLTDCSHANP